jgi:hypothetical protein
MSTSYHTCFFGQIQRLWLTEGFIYLFIFAKNWLLNGVMSGSLWRQYVNEVYLVKGNCNYPPPFFSFFFSSIYMHLIVFLVHTSCYFVNQKECHKFLYGLYIYQPVNKTAFCPDKNPLKLFVRIWENSSK